MKLSLRYPAEELLPAARCRAGGHSRSTPRRLVIVVSHPIQHFVPFYRALARHPEIDLKVIYGSRIGLEPYFDAAMNTTIAWNMDLLSGYDHSFLPEAPAIAAAGPLDVDNPSIGNELAFQAPDAVLIYGYTHLTSLRALWWCRRNHVPAMMISDSELKKPRSAAVAIAKRLLLPPLLSQFRAFLTVGDCNEEYYRHYGVPADRLFRSPFTIDEERYSAARRQSGELRRNVRERLGIGASEVVALTVGKLSKRKRPEDLVRVAALLKLRSSRHPVTFVLAGNGSELERLQGLAAAQALPVRFPGFVNVDELPAFYAAADLIVHPSENDPHPLVMSEGAAMGLPLLVSDRVGAAGPSDIVRPGENAIIFPVGDVERIAETVQGLVNDPARRSVMGERSREIFEELDMRRSVAGAVEAVRHSVACE